MRTALLIILCFFFPFLAVLIHEGPTRRVLWAVLFQILGHIPGIVYGIYVVTSPPVPPEPAPASLGSVRLYAAEDLPVAVGERPRR